MGHMQKNDKTKEREDQVENKRGDRKGESNDSPEIPDRRKPSDIPGLLLKKRGLQCYTQVPPTEKNRKHTTTTSIQQNTHMHNSMKNKEKTKRELDK